MFCWQPSWNKTNSKSAHLVAECNQTWLLSIFFGLSWLSGTLQLQNFWSLTSQENVRNQLPTCKSVRQVMKSSDSYVQQSHETWQVCLSDAFLYVFVTRKKTMLYMYMYNVLTSCQGFFVKLLHAQWLLRFLFSPSNHHKTSKIKRGYERIKIIHSMCWRYNLFSS